MTDKSRRLLIAAVLVAVFVIGFRLWWNAPVRAATRALLSLVDTLQIEGDESAIARQGKGARLGRAVSNPVDIKFQEAGRDGEWSAESLQMRYVSGALAAKTATIALEDLTAEKADSDGVEINALLKANYSGQGTNPKKIERRCRWIMEKIEGRWVIASFREIDPAS